MNTAKLAVLIQGHLDSGKKLEEALELVKGEMTNRGGMTVSELKECEDLTLVRKFIKGAHAKMSKAKSSGNADAMARYRTEIDAGNARKTELRALFTRDGIVVDFTKARELGEAEGPLLQAFISDREVEAAEAIQDIKAAGNFTNKAIKVSTQTMEIKVQGRLEKDLEDIGLLTAFLERAKKDTRVISLVQKVNFVDSDPLKDIKTEVVEIKEDKKAAKK